MSKMKRKWLRVIEYEETGRPLDAATRESLLETHPDLPILHDGAAMPEAEAKWPEGAEVAVMHGVDEVMMGGLPVEPQIDSQLDSQLQMQIQAEIASAEPPRV